MDCPEWIDRAKPIEDVRVDIGFVVSESFYYGPSDELTSEQWRQPLYQPKIRPYRPKRAGEYFLSSDVEGATPELLRHYQDVLDLAVRYQRLERYYFWLRPLIFSENGFAITFPWYDTWAEAKPMLDAIKTSGEGLIFNDVEQGWEVEVFAKSGRLFLRQSNFDSGEEYEVASIDRVQLVDQIPEVRKRVERLIQELSTTIGRDYWSHR